MPIPPCFTSRDFLLYLKKTRLQMCNIFVFFLRVRLFIIKKIMISVKNNNLK
jgi:hypothetical protein